MKYVALLEVDNDIIIHGDECVTDLSGLYKAIVQKDTTEIEIRKEFADNFFTYSALCDFVAYTAALAPNILITVQDTVYDNLSAAVKLLSEYSTQESLIYALNSKPDLILQTIQSLCAYFNDIHDEQSVSNNKIASLRVRIDELQRELQRMSDKYSDTQDNANVLSSKLQTLISRTNFRYDKTINPDEMFVCKHNAYNSILYIREITRVHYTDTLVYYLQEILRTLYGCPVRSVVIEPFYAYKRIEMYPGYKPHWHLSYRDVYSGNIFMAGFQPKLMTDILYNSNKVNYLIVLDRGGYMTPHIEGKNVHLVHTASDLKDVHGDIDLSTVISYNESTLNIPYIDDFENLSPEQRVQKYSSMPVTKQLLKVLEEVK